uniref:Small-conductance mechanosensitive channel n=1 Tax=Paulinella longichromatophora TaxID=1708747 RepID=A0A2H4ZQ72_9EUKA|nr:small-conductance mechanosensitive channel [Paulinella longichromatophora]
MSSYTADVIEAIIRWILGCTVIWGVATMIRYIIAYTAQRTRIVIDRLVIGILFNAFFIVGLSTVTVWAWDAAPSKGEGDVVLHHVSRVLVSVVVVRLIDTLCLRFLEQALTDSEDNSNTDMLVAFAPMIRALIWALGILLYFQYRGVGFTNICAALAGAGIGLGFALQGPARDFTNYLTILLDKPFSVGQLIKYGEIVARVEKVGVRSTQLRSMDGERVVVSHEDLLDATLHNLADIPRRRLLHRIGVTYQTSAETLEEIPELTRKVISTIDGAEFGRCHLILFADSALEFELVFYIPNNDYSFALDTQHRVTIGIVRAFLEKGIEFAYPTQKVYIERNIEINNNDEFEEEILSKSFKKQRALS